MRSQILLFLLFLFSLALVGCWGSDGDDTLNLTLTHAECCDEWSLRDYLIMMDCDPVRERPIMTLVPPLAPGPEPPAPTAPPPLADPPYQPSPIDPADDDVLEGRSYWNGHILFFDCEPKLEGACDD